MRYAISYDLRQPGRNYQKLYDELEKFGGQRILLSQWVARRTGTNAARLRDYIRRFIDSNDRLMVTCLDDDDWAGWNLTNRPSKM